MYNTLKVVLNKLDPSLWKCTGSIKSQNPKITDFKASRGVTIINSQLTASDESIENYIEQ